MRLFLVGGFLLLLIALAPRAPQTLATPRATLTPAPPTATWPMVTVLPFPTVQAYPAPAVATPAPARRPSFGESVRRWWQSR